MPLKRRQLIQLSLFAFLFGIVLGAFFELHIIFIAAWALSMPAAFFSGKRLLFILLGVFCLLGGMRSLGEYQLLDSQELKQEVTDEGEKMTIRGEIERMPDIRFRKELWILSATEKLEKGGWKETSGNTLLVLATNAPLSIGDHVEVRGTVKVPFESEEFSYENYLMSKNITTISYYPGVKVLDTNETFLGTLYDLRQYALRALVQDVRLPAAAYAAGILMGDKSLFLPEMEEEFRVTGLLHILALSGYNITILILFLFAIFAFLPKGSRLIITAITILIFVLFVGGGSSIIRASIMGVLGLLVLHSGNKTNSITLLLLASSLMCLWSPLSFAFDASFQLSFAGVIGIIFFAPYFLKKIPGPLVIREILATTLGAQIGVLPLLLYLFSQVSLIAPISNLLIAPLIPLSMLLAFLTILVHEIAILGLLFGFLSWVLLSIQLHLIKWMATIPYASVDVELSKMGFLVFLAVIWIFILWKILKAR